MKFKNLFIIAIMCIAVLTSCGKPSENSSSTPTTNENSNIEVEPAPMCADSVDELITKIQKVKSGKEDDIANVSSLKSLIVPDFSLKDYQLMQIAVSDMSVFYYYSPTSTEKENYIVDRERDIVVTVIREEDVNKEDPLKPLIEQLKITPNEDGVLFDKNRREITYVYGSVWISVCAPKEFETYQSIKALCSAKTVALS